METKAPFFSDAALAILDRMPFDARAVPVYDMISGGLHWHDEFPKPPDPAWEIVRAGWAFRFLLGYRASLTIAKERPELRLPWQQVVELAPRWPGLRPERVGDAPRQLLLVAKRRDERCLAKLLSGSGTTGTS